jgi:hypothetical protein
VRTAAFVSAAVGLGLVVGVPLGAGIVYVLTRVWPRSDLPIEWEAMD